MTVIVDAGPLYAQADRRDPDHAAVTAALQAERGPLVVPSFVAAEVDFFILRRLGIDAEIAFVEDLVSGTYLVEHPTPQEMRTILDLVRRYRDLALGIADAAVVVLADRHRTTRLFTFDERAFHAVKPLHGKHFELLPADR